MATPGEWKHKGTGQIVLTILTTALLGLGFVQHFLWGVCALCMAILLWSLGSHPRVAGWIEKVGEHFRWPFVLNVPPSPSSSITLPEGAMLMAAVGSRNQAFLVRVVAPKGGLEIIEARYGMGMTMKDVTEIVNQRVSGNTLRMLVSNDELGGDPLPYVGKILTIKFRFNDTEEFVSIPESQWVILPWVELQAPQS
ncbi:MAG TPA: hypothetical protein VMV53_11805 [Acidimicrobiales bacterium]|nr:hypothetical protein [Acidimicrobiales bacterium]